MFDKIFKSELVKENIQLKKRVKVVEEELDRFKKARIIMSKDEFLKLAERDLVLKNPRPIYYSKMSSQKFIEAEEIKTNYIQVLEWIV